MGDLTFTCPVCGADVLRNAKACPECGACEKSGWNEDRYLDGLNLPGEGFDDPTYSARQIGNGDRMTGRQRLLLIITVLLIVAMAWLTLRGMW
jgi:hypothetical protein